MTEPNADQVQKGQSKEPEKKPGFDEFFAKGWETIDADEAASAEAAKEAKPAEETPPKKVEPECPDCPEGKFYRIIKHNGKDVGIKTEKEYNDYVMQGFDYTKKTQALAEERRQFQNERQGLLDRLDKLEKGAAPAKPAEDTGKAKPAEESAKGQPQTEAEIFAEYGLDPEYASDFEKKLVKNQVAMQKENQELRGLTQVIFLKEMTKTITDSLAEAVKEFPVEDILDESGKSMTGELVMSTFKAIVTDPANQKTPLRDLARMAVKKVHESQQVAKGTVETVDEEKMTVADFAKRWPKLYAKIMKEGGREGVTEFLEQQEELPPTITSRKADVPATERKETPKFSGLSDAIDKGMDALFPGG